MSICFPLLLFYYFTVHMYWQWVCLLMLFLFLFPHRENYFSCGSSTCRDFHIRRSLKILPHVYEALLPGFPRTSWCRLHARLCFIWFISSSRHEEKVIDINNRVNAISQQQWTIFPSRFKNTFCYISILDRSQLDCARVRIQIFTGRGALNIPFRECESALRVAFMKLYVFLYTCIYIYVCARICVFVALRRVLAEKTLDTGI